MQAVGNESPSGSHRVGSCKPGLVRSKVAPKSFLLPAISLSIHKDFGMEEVEDKNDFLWMEEGDNANFNRQYINSYPAYLDLTVNLITFVA